MAEFAWIVVEFLAELAGHTLEFVWRAVRGLARRPETPALRAVRALGIRCLVGSLACGSLATACPSPLLYPLVGCALSLFVAAVVCGGICAEDTGSCGKDTPRSRRLARARHSRGVHQAKSARA